MIDTDKDKDNPKRTLQVLLAQEKVPVSVPVNGIISKN